MDDAMLPYRTPRSAASQNNAPSEGEVWDVGPAGLRFTIKDWDGGKHVFGPAPWPMSRVEPVSHTHPVTVTVSDTYSGGGSGSGTAQPTTHDHAETLPKRGDRALVLFLGDGIERPWVLSWWPA